MISTRKKLKITALVVMTMCSVASVQAENTEGPIRGGARMPMMPMMMGRDMMDHDMMMGCPNAMMGNGGRFWRWFERGDDGWKSAGAVELPENLAQTLGMTTKQTQEISDARKAYVRRYDEIREKIAANRKAINKLYLSENPDIEKIMHHYRAMYDNLFLLAEARIRTEQRVQQILTDTQQKNLAILKRWLMGSGDGL